MNDPTALVGVACSFLVLLLIGCIVIVVRVPARDRNYLLYLFLSLFSASFSCFLYYAYDDLAAGGRGFRGGDDRMWFEAGQNTLTELKSGRSLYDIIWNGVEVDATSPMHPQQTIETGRIGYPLLLSFIMGIGINNLMIIMVFNCFLGSLIPLISYKIGNSISCQFDGRKAVLFVSFSQLIFYAGANYRDVHIGFLFALTTLVCVRFIKKTNSLRLLQLIVLTLFIYMFRYISGLIIALGEMSTLVLFFRVRYKFIIAIVFVLLAIITMSIEFPVITDKVTSTISGQFIQTLANTGEDLGFESASLTRTIMSRFIDSPLVLVLLPIPAIVLQLISPPVDMTSTMWVLYLTNAVRFVFFLPCMLSGIYYITSHSNIKELKIILIIYLIAIIGYAPISIFMGNRYMISMIPIEAVFVGLGSENIKKYGKLQKMWIVMAVIYSIWHWIYKVTPSV